MQPDPGPESVAYLLDRLAIDDLMARYSFAVDDEDFALLDSVFLPDAILDYSSAGGPRGPYPQVKAWLIDGLRAGDPVRQHVIAQRRVTIESDSARLRAYFFNPFTVVDAEGQSSVSLGGGYYDHRLIRTAEGWRSAEMLMRRVWRQGLPGRLHPHAARSTETWDFGGPARPRDTSEKGQA